MSSIPSAFSIVIPLYNEELNIIPLCDEIFSVMNTDFIGSNYEVILVNDGSADGTREKMVELKNLNKKCEIKCINLQRNYGQSIALEVGFRNSKGEYIISLDGDNQNDPKDIKKLYDKMIKDNLDVVTGRRKKRKDPLSVRIITRCSRFFRNILLGDKVHDSGCTLRIYKKSCIENLHLWGEMHRYIAEILTIKGYNVGEVPVNHRLRTNGFSKYTWKKSIKGFIDLLYIRFIAKYQSRPLHLFGFVGLSTFLLGIVSFIYSIYAKIVLGLSLNRSGFFLLGVFLIQTGIMIFIFGIVIDILIRIYYNSGNERRYTIKEIIE